jgi:hypothetical protein
VSKHDVELAKARAALERGKLKVAVGHAWAAGLAAVRASDEQQLEPVVQLAAVLCERSSGKLRGEAERLSAYCAGALADLRAGVVRSSGAGGLLRLGRRGDEGPAVSRPRGRRWPGRPPRG